MATIRWLLILLVAACAPVVAGPASPALPDRTSLSLPDFPLAFQQNRGQLAPEVLYRLESRDQDWFLGPEGFEVDLHASGERGQASSRIRFAFAGPSRHARAEAEGKPGAVVSEFRKETLGAPGSVCYPGVVYRDLWPGTTLRFAAERDAVKWEIRLDRADRLRQAYWTIEGADEAAVDPQGNLLIRNGGGLLLDQAPLAWQEKAGRRVAVPCRYRLSPGPGGDRLGFELGGHDPSLPLVIDPMVRLWNIATGGFSIRDMVFSQGGDLFMAGSRDNRSWIGCVDGDTGAWKFLVRMADRTPSSALSVAITPSGEVAVTGFGVLPADVPVVVGPNPVIEAGARIFYLSRISGDGSRLISHGYLQGYAADLAIDSRGRILVAASSDTKELVNPFQGVEAGSSAFLYRVSADGAAILNSTYFGAPQTAITSLAVTMDDRPLFVGWTSSSAAQGFPLKVGPDLTFNGVDDGFVAQLAPDMQTLDFSGYIGGDFRDYAQAVVVDTLGRPVVGLNFASSHGSLPIRGGPYPFERGPGPYVALVEPDGSGLIYCGSMSPRADFDSAPRDLDSDGRGGYWMTFKPTESDGSSVRVNSAGAPIDDLTSRVSGIPVVAVDPRGLATGSQSPTAGLARDVQPDSSISAPGNLRLTGSGANGISLEWTDTSTGETGFEVERAAQGSFVFFTVAVVGVDATSFTDSTARAGGSYTYRVRAASSTTRSAHSNEVAATAPLGRPAAPSGLIAAPEGTSGIRLTWVDNSLNETSFRIERAAGEAGAFVEVAQTASDVTTHLDTTAGKNQLYRYRIRAASAQGFSGYSNIASATIDSRPKAPRDCRVVETSRTSFLLSWSDLSDNETSFEVERSIDGGAFGSRVVIAADTTSYADTGLVSGDLYLYRVRSVNADGASAWCESNLITLRRLQPPDTPANCRARSSGPASIRIRWDDTTTETHFEMARSANGNPYGPTWTVSRNVNEYDDTGLIGGVPYRYIIRAVNEDGASAWCETDAVAPGVNPPAAPTNCTAEVTGNGSIRVSWTYGEGEIAGFEMRRSVDGGSFAFVASVGATLRVFDDTGLEAGHTYRYQIKAVNLGGGSEWCESNSVTLNAILPIPPPTNLSGEVVSAGRIILRWQDPSDEETGFGIERAAAHGPFEALAVAPPGATAYTDASTAAGTTYRYRVRTLRGAEASEPSNEVTLFTGAEGLLVVSPPKLNFGKVRLNRHGRRVARIRNQGNGRLSVRVGPIEPADGPFAVEGETNFVVQPGQFRQVVFIFTPTTRGIFSAAVPITSDGGTAAVALKGKGR